MAQRLRAYVAFAEDPSLIPSLYMVAHNHLQYQYMQAKILSHIKQQNKQMFKIMKKMDRSPCVIWEKGKESLTDFWYLSQSQI